MISLFSFRLICLVTLYYEYFAAEKLVKKILIKVYCICAFPLTHNSMSNRIEEQIKSVNRIESLTWYRTTQSSSRFTSASVMNATHRDMTFFRQNMSMNSTLFFIGEVDGKHRFSLLLRLFLYVQHFIWNVKEFFQMWRRREEKALKTSRNAIWIDRLVVVESNVNFQQTLKKNSKTFFYE